MGCSLHWALHRCGGEDPTALYKAAREAFKGKQYMVSGWVRGEERGICGEERREEFIYTKWYHFGWREESVGRNHPFWCPFVDQVDIIVVV